MFATAFTRRAGRPLRTRLSGELNVTAVLAPGGDVAPDTLDAVEACRASSRASRTFRASRTSRISRAAAAFTLLEILVVIALIALLTSVLVIGTTRLLRERPLTPDELFWAATRAARKDALLNNHEVRFLFDSKTAEFVASAEGQEVRFPFVPKEVAEFDFLAPKSLGASSAILVGGTLVETQTIPLVRFYGDGTCSPFRAQLKTKSGVTVLEIDPWTCAPMLTEKAGT